MFSDDVYKFTCLREFMLQPQALCLGLFYFANTIYIGTATFIKNSATFCKCIDIKVVANNFWDCVQNCVQLCTISYRRRNIFITLLWIHIISTCREMVCKQCTVNNEVGSKMCKQNIFVVSCTTPCSYASLLVEQTTTFISRIRDQ